MQFFDKRTKRRRGEKLYLHAILFVWGIYIDYILVFVVNVIIIWIYCNKKTKKQQEEKNENAEKENHFFIFDILIAEEKGTSSIFSSFL